MGMATIYHTFESAVATHGYGHSFFALCSVYTKVTDLSIYTAVLYMHY